jgi:hypothetical protein
MDDQNPKLDETRSVTQGVGKVKSDRSVGNERPKSSGSRLRSDDDYSGVSNEHSERANIAGGAVTNDDGVSKGGR